MMKVVKITVSSLKNLLSEPSEFMSQQRTRLYLEIGVPI